MVTISEDDWRILRETLVNERNIKNPMVYITDMYKFKFTWGFVEGLGTVISLMFDVQEDELFFRLKYGI